MPNSRAKGRRGELEWAAKWDGERISEAGMSGPDVRTRPLHVDGLMLWEVKRPARVARLYEWLEQARREGAQGLAIRADRREWLVILPADRLR